MTEAREVGTATVATGLATAGVGSGRVGRAGMEDKVVSTAGVATGAWAGGGAAMLPVWLTVSTTLIRIHALGP